MRVESFSDMFERLCPSYMAMGMTYEQFWYGDPWMAKAFRQAWQFKIEYTSRDAWLYGAYVMEGVGVVLHNALSKRGAKPAKYPEAPHRLTPLTPFEEAIKAREEREKVVAFFTNMAKNMGGDWRGDND